MTYSKIYPSSAIKNYHFPETGKQIFFYVGNDIKHTTFISIDIFYGGPKGMFIVLEFDGNIPFTQGQFKDMDFPLNTWAYNANELIQKTLEKYRK